MKTPNIIPLPSSLLSSPLDTSSTQNFHPSILSFLPQQAWLISEQIPNDIPQNLSLQLCNCHLYIYIYFKKTEPTLTVSVFQTTNDMTNRPVQLGDVLTWKKTLKRCDLLFFSSKRRTRVSQKKCTDTNPSVPCHTWRFPPTPSPPPPGQNLWSRPVRMAKYYGDLLRLGTYARVPLQPPRNWRPNQTQQSRLAPFHCFRYLCPVPDNFHGHIDVTIRIRDVYYCPKLYSSFICTSDWSAAQTVAVTWVWVFDLFCMSFSFDMICFLWTFLCKDSGCHAEKNPCGKPWAGGPSTVDDMMEKGNGLKSIEPLVGGGGVGIECVTLFSQIKTMSFLYIKGPF